MRDEITKELRDITTISLINEKYCYKVLFTKSTSLVFIVLGPK